MGDRKKTYWEQPIKENIDKFNFIKTKHLISSKNITNDVQSRSYAKWNFQCIYLTKITVTIKKIIAMN